MNRILHLIANCDEPVRAPFIAAHLSLPKPTVATYLRRLHGRALVSTVHRGEYIATTKGKHWE